MLDNCIFTPRFKKFLAHEEKRFWKAVVALHPQLEQDFNAPHAGVANKAYQEIYNKGCSMAKEEFDTLTEAQLIELDRKPDAPEEEE